jgi:hypothetical protein
MANEPKGDAVHRLAPILAGLLAIAPGTAYAWGKSGHHIVTSAAHAVGLHVGLE